MERLGLYTKKSVTKITCWMILYEMSGIGKSIETGTRIVVTRVCDYEEQLFNGYRLFLGWPLLRHEFLVLLYFDICQFCHDSLNRSQNPLKLPVVIEWIRIRDYLCIVGDSESSFQSLVLIYFYVVEMAAPSLCSFCHKLTFCFLEEYKMCSKCHVAYCSCFF